MRLLVIILLNKDCLLIIIIYFFPYYWEDRRTIIQQTIFTLSSKPAMVSIKNLIALSFLGVIATADYSVTIMDVCGDGTSLDATSRTCFCTSNMDTNTIMNMNGGIVKLFTTTDCTGSYDVMGSVEELNDATWVNSISLGPAGSSSFNGVCEYWGQSTGPC